MNHYNEIIRFEYVLILRSNYYEIIREALQGVLEIIREVLQCY